METRQEFLEQSREGRVRAEDDLRLGIVVGDILKGESTRPVTNWIWRRAKKG